MPDHKLLTALAVVLLGLPFLATRPLWNGLAVGAALIAALFLTLLRLRDRYRDVMVAAVVVSVLVIYEQWGIGHFIVQNDFNLFLLGESRLSSGQAGIAKFLLGETKLIRAYGPFSHPNELAGLLSLGLLLLATLPRPRLRYFYFHLFVLILALILTFSRAAYLSVIILSLVAARHYAGYINSKRIISALLALLVFSPLVAARLSDPEDVGISERLEGYRAAWSITQAAPFWFISGDSYATRLQDYSTSAGVPLQPWQIDYVHSVPLLLAAYVGWGGAAAVVLVVCFLTLWLYGRGAVWILPAVPLLLFDHYFLTDVSLAAWAAVIYVLVPRFVMVRWYT